VAARLPEEQPLDVEGAVAKSWPVKRVMVERNDWATSQDQMLSREDVR
jgi:hypothetical protein